MEQLAALFVYRGTPAYLRSDNGPELAVIDARRLGAIESKTGHGCRFWRARWVFGSDSQGLCAWIDTRVE